jgi:hypothetical protein
LEPGIRPDVPKKKVKISEITVLAQPVSLRRKVTVYNVTFLILECPWGNDQDITFTYPDPLFYLPFDPAHTGDPVIALDANMVCTHGKVSKSKLLVLPLLWEADPDGRGAVFIYCIKINGIVVLFWIITNSNISL